jgi:hypothetical protein
MNFLDRLKEMLAGAGDTATDIASRVRYGVSPQDKMGMTLSRALPGAPSYLEDPAAAERYSSTYLGAKKWGKLPAEFFNALALSDIGQGASGERRKAIGASGAEAGAMAGQIGEQRRLAALQALFSGRRGM